LWIHWHWGGMTSRAERRCRNSRQKTERSGASRKRHTQKKNRREL
jgi:hypothetical protein